MAGSIQTGIIRYGRTVITLTGDVTLTDAQQKSGILEFAGTPGVACTVTLYSATDGHAWDLYNACGSNVTLKVAAATGVTVANTKRCRVYCDGTDVRRVSPDT